MVGGRHNRLKVGGPRPRSAHSSYFLQSAQPFQTTLDCLQLVSQAHLDAKSSEKLGSAGSSGSSKGKGESAGSSAAASSAIVTWLWGSNWLSAHARRSCRHKTSLPWASKDPVLSTVHRGNGARRVNDVRLTAAQDKEVLLHSPPAQSTPVRFVHRTWRGPALDRQTVTGISSSLRTAFITETRCIHSRFEIRES